MSVSGDTVLSGSTSISVEAVVVVVPTSLEDQITAVAGQDTILMGATGYLDVIATSRLASDTE
jgi:hypothetical protein